MGCNCGSSRSSSGKTLTFVHTAPNGTTTTYAKESDARLAMSREGGKVTPK